MEAVHIPKKRTICKIQKIRLYQSRAISIFTHIHAQPVHLNSGHHLSILSTLYTLTPTRLAVTSTYRSEYKPQFVNLKHPTYTSTRIYKFIQAQISEQATMFIIQPRINNKRNVACKSNDPSNRCLVGKCPDWPCHKEQSAF